MLSVGQFDKSVLIFGVNNSSWVHADNRKKEILVIGEGTMDGLDDPSINQLNILLILLSIEIKFIWVYTTMRAIIFLYVNSIKTQTPKARTLKWYPLILGKISKDFTVDNIKRTGVNGKNFHYFVSHGTIDVSDIEDNHKNLIKKHNVV